MKCIRNYVVSDWFQNWSLSSANEFLECGSTLELFQPFQLCCKNRGNAIVVHMTQCQMHHENLMRWKEVVHAKLCCKGTNIMIALWTRNSRQEYFKEFWRIIQCHSILFPFYFQWEKNPDINVRTTDFYPFSLFQSDDSLKCLSCSVAGNKCRNVFNSGILLVVISISKFWIRLPAK